MFDIPDPHECMACPLLDCSGLSALDEHQRQYMQTIKKGERLFERGECIIREDEHTKQLYTVLEGVLIRYHLMEDGRRQIVNFMFPGDLVGLQGAFDEPSGHSVEPLSAARLCIFERGDFIHLIKENPDLGYEVTWLAAKEENSLESHLVSLGQRSAKERLAFLAVWLLDRAIATGLAHDNILDIQITQSQIADMLGLSLVHTNRTIRALDREGLVRWQQRKISVPDMEKAAEFSGFDTSNSRIRPYI